MKLFIKLLVLISLTSNINTLSANSSFENIASLCGDRSCEAIYSKMKKFARNGSAHAQAIMALFYRGGHGVEVNNEVSVKYMKRAARNGLAFAQYDLAILYRNGYFVEKDIEEGNRWLKLAAKGGYANAIELMLSEELISKEESIELQRQNELPELQQGEEVITITRDSYTLSDLVDLLTSHGFNSSNQTGTRIPGKGCGNNASSCVSWKINTPIRNTEFMNMMSKINAFQTALEVRGR